MRDVRGVGATDSEPVLRPDKSMEHPNSGMPSHDLVGGNVFVSYVLASTVEGSPEYDAVNARLLSQGPAVPLTLDLNAGLGVDATAMLAFVDAAKEQLRAAATIEAVTYSQETGALAFRVVNHTGHKLISGFPEGRRMFVNVKAYSGDALVEELNPYDETLGTLKGLEPEYSANSPALNERERYVDELVYEMHPSSKLTGEKKTFHFALATGRSKDNRIPPRDFRIADAPTRLVEPVWKGDVKMDLYSEEEYAGGYDDVALDLKLGADRVEIRLYYQTTSREYIEFLRDEINGVNTTLTSPTPSGEEVAYVVQTDPFFSQMRDWGDAVWRLWEHNKDVPGAAPFLMAQAEAIAGGGEGEDGTRK